LTLYEELVATGISDEQAKIIAHQQGALSDETGGRYSDLNQKLDKTIHEFHLKLDTTFSTVETNMAWIKNIGMAIVAAIIANIVAVYLK